MPSTTIATSSRTSFSSPGSSCTGGRTCHRFVCGQTIIVRRPGGPGVHSSPWQSWSSSRWWWRPDSAWTMPGRTARCCPIRLAWPSTWTACQPKTEPVKSTSSCGMTSAFPPGSRSRRSALLPRISWASSIELLPLLPQARAAGPLPAVYDGRHTFQRPDPTWITRPGSERAVSPPARDPDCERLSLNSHSSQRERLLEAG